MDKLTKELITKTAFERAYAAWFSDYERERRKAGKRKGEKIPGLPAPPTSPAQITEALDRFGRLRFLTIIGVHRSTLTRWERGLAVMPRPAWLLLVLLDDGRLPGMGTAWQALRIEGDRLHLVGTRYSYSALEIAGWHYQTAHSLSLSREIAALQKQIAHLLKVGDFQAANDPITCVS